MNRTAYKTLIALTILVILASIVGVGALLSTDALIGEYKTKAAIFLVTVFATVVIAFLAHCAGEEIRSGKPASIHSLKVGESVCLEYYGCHSIGNSAYLLIIVRTAAGEFYYLGDDFDQFSKIPSPIPGQWYEWNGRRLIDAEASARARAV